MHSVTIGNRIKVGSTIIEADTPYLMSNVLTGMLMSNDTIVEGVPFYSKVSAQKRVLDFGIKPKSQVVWLIRTGGFGDLLMLTPTIRRILEKGYFVNVVCEGSYKCLFDGWATRFGDRFKVWDDPIREDLIPSEDTVICYEGVIEGAEKAKTVHAVDLFGKWAGVEIEDRTLTYHLSVGEEKWAGIVYPKTEKKRVGIQARASAAVRTYDPSLLAVVIELLRSEGNEVFLFGAPGDITCDMKDIVNLSESGLTFRQSVAVMSTCDAFFAPDSALAHVAQAIEIPLLALYGSFPSHLRVTGDPSITDVIDAKGECAPCFHHAGVRPENKWPMEGPCRKADFCTVLAGVSPGKIAKRIVNLMGGV